MFNILVVEDDHNARRLMTTVLENEGYRAIGAQNGQAALDVMENAHIDLIVLDLMMPIMDGMELTKTLRETGFDMPIIMVTAKESVRDKCDGLKVGADDYIVKPFDEEELLLRIRALLRRYKIANEKSLTVGASILDFESMSVRTGDNVSYLPQKEFLILFKFMSFPNKIFTRRQLMDEFWDMNSDSDERTVDVHINRLREKFKENDDFEIVTVRGLGYKGVIKTEV